MANQEQLAILKQGAKVWNEWREKNFDVKPDLSHAKLQINLDHANLSETDLTRADLKGTGLSYTRLDYADLSYANLEHSKLHRADLFQANLTGANLRHVDFRNADLMGTDLTNADLSEAELSVARFTETILSGTDFTKSLIGIFVWDIAHIGSSTHFINVDLSTARGLEAVEHFGPSEVSISTIFRSGGNIPEVFLRGCGLSDVDIEYAKLANLGLAAEQITETAYKIQQLRTGGSILYFSCFISYSRKDQEFAQKLYDDLQNSGVRCWFDREDLKIGDAIRSTIDSQIRLRDKLLVILSKNSIQSEWVGDEVEGALEEEQQANRSVLFPIRLDDTVLKTRDDWAAKIKRRRHIGDFSNWTDEASYQKSFKRLLRDLKAKN